MQVVKSARVKVGPKDGLALGVALKNDTTLAKKPKTLGDSSVFKDLKSQDHVLI